MKIRRSSLGMDGTEWSQSRKLKWGRRSGGSIFDPQSAIDDLQSFIFASICVHSWFEIFIFSVSVFVSAKFGDGIEQRIGEELDAEVDRSQEAIFHEDDVAAVCIGNDNVSLRIEKGGVALDLKSLPAVIVEESNDLFIGSRRARNGWLADQEPEAGLCLERA